MASTTYSRRQSHFHEIFCAFRAFRGQKMGCGRSVRAKSFRAFRCSKRMHYEVFTAAIAVFLRLGFKKAEVALHYFFYLSSIIKLQS